VSATAEDDWNDIDHLGDDPTAGSVPMEPANDFPPTLGQSLPHAIERMRRRIRGEERPVPLPWKRLELALGGGLWPGAYVLVGNTGTGKTQWALQVALHAAEQDLPVLYIALELSTDALCARLLGTVAELPWSSLHLGQDGDALEAAYEQHGALLERLPLHIEEGPPYGWSHDQLRPAVELLKARYADRLEGRTPLVILDYMQLVSSSGDQGREDLRERIQQTAYAARFVAKSENVAVLLVSSTARQNYSGLDGAGQGLPVWQGSPSTLVGMGKESGEVEYAADGVLVLVREPWADGMPPVAGTRVHLAVAKLRHGPASWCDLVFDGSRFTEPPPRSTVPAPKRR